MQKDGTVMLGTNFLNNSITPTGFDYHTFNYFLNITFLQFFEVSYTCTLFKAPPSVVAIYPWKEGHFTNQDRAFSARARILRERKYFPSLVFGINDLFTQASGGVIASTNRNGHFNRFFLSATKHFSLGNRKEDLGVHLTYMYNRRVNEPAKGFMGGITYNPSFAKELRFIAEYNPAGFCVGANYLLLKHVFVQVLLEDFKHFSCGMSYKIYLKK